MGLFGLGLESVFMLKIYMVFIDILFVVCLEYVDILMVVGGDYLKVCLR